MTKRAVYPGSFDPATTGHLDIIARAVSVVDSIVIGVAIDNEKNSLLSVEKRVLLLKVAVAKLDNSQNIEVVAFSGLLVDFARTQNANVIVRGLRAVSDFEFEFQMAAMNRKLAEDIETIFLMAGDSQQFVSSRFVKEINRLGGNVSQFVDVETYNALQEKE